MEPTLRFDEADSLFGRRAEVRCGHDRSANLETDYLFHDEPGAWASWQTGAVDDEELLALAESTLTEIKVAQGLSEQHASVLAALRIRLKGSAGTSLEEMLAAAGDVGSVSLEEKLAEAESKRKPSLDDLISKEPKKPDWPT